MTDRVQGLAAMILATAALAGSVSAQLVSLEITRRGLFDADVEAEGREVPILTILSAITRKMELELEVADASTTETLARTTADVSLAEMSLEHIVALLAGAADLHASIDFQNRTIRIEPMPSRDDPRAAELFRREALAELLRAFGGDEDPEHQVELLWRSAELHVAGGNYRAASDALRQLLAGFKSHPRGPEACLLAGRCALKSNDVDGALEMADFFLNEYPRRRGSVKARILAVQSFLAQNNVADAEALLRGIIRDGRGPRIEERDVLVAELLLAELLHETADHDGALEVLGQIRWRHDPTINKDLLGQVPLFMGIVHTAQGRIDRAVHDLRLAAYTCATPKLRGRALRAQARVFLMLDSPFESLAATRVAMQLEPRGRDLIESRRLEARAYRAMFLDARAVEVLIALVESLPEIVTDATERDAAAAAILEEIGIILFEAEDWTRARDVFARVRGVEGIGPRAVLMMAKAELRSGNPRRALEVLDAMPSGATPDAARDALALRGDCYVELKLYERAINVWTGEGR